MSENIDHKVTQGKEQGAAERGARDVGRAAQAAITQAAAAAAEGNLPGQSGSDSSSSND